MATTNGTTFRRPQLTRYVRAFNALGSPLYWKAANERTDGNTDDTFDASSPPDDRDLDFGADHPTEITPDELGMLARWIDIGAPGGPAERDDTQRPTLTLAALYDEDTVTHLRVGTVDFDTAGTDDSEFRFVGISDPTGVAAAVDRAQRDATTGPLPPRTPAP